KIKANLKSWVCSLPSTPAKPVVYDFPKPKPREAFVIPSMVQYTGKGYSFRKLGFEYKGSMEVLKTILSLDYLWNKVRVQGGAYGCFLMQSPNGQFILCSYRDPNLQKTLNAYDGTVQYLKDMDISDFEMTKYIIGTIRNFDQPKTASGKSAAEDRYYFKNTTQKDVQKQRDEILATDVPALKSYLEMVERVMKEDCYCVFGSSNKINEEKELFTEIITVLK
ncbi:MAG: insulinase family protein, partial [Candidatus Cloacimonetes bacterium]|nr:insulinase family protein [Candidatus Cloacimonadota bacterium]